MTVSAEAVVLAEGIDNKVTVAKKIVSNEPKDDWIVDFRLAKAKLVIPRANRTEALSARL